MVPDLPSVSVLAAFAAFNAVLLTYLLIRWRTGGHGFPWSASGSSRTERVEGATIACPECGASNDLEYRFCRRCVAELQAGGAGDQRPTGVEGQQS